MAVITGEFEPHTLLKNTLKKSLNGRKMYEYFMSAFYDLHTGTSNNPDIGGYYMIYLIPPALSGLLSNTADVTKESRKQLSVNKAIILYAQTISLPAHQIQLNTIKSQSDISMPFATGVFKSGSMNISFMDTENMDMYYFHHLWADYIESVLFGDIIPKQEYIDTCTMDYATSAYILKFKSNMSNPIYIGKATGVILEGLPHNEIIGNRTGPELTNFNITYNCTHYSGIMLADKKTTIMRGGTDKGANIRNSYIIDEFNTELLTLYS